MFSANTPILIVDDMPTVRMLVSRVCEEAGYPQTQEVGDIAAAWSAITNADPKFGLAVVDFNMGSASSLDLLRRVRSDSRFRLLPFVMLVVNEDQAHVAEILSSGADAVLLKPFNAAVFTEKLEIVRKKRANDGK